MTEKYFVFDYTPISLHGEDFVLVGMAKKDADYVSKPDPEPINPDDQKKEDDNHDQFPEDRDNLSDEQQKKYDEMVE